MDFNLCFILNLMFVCLFQQPALVSGFFGKIEGVVNLTDKNFDEVILNSTDVWVVEFYTEWCAYCRGFGKEIEELAHMTDTFKVAAINSDENKKIDKRYKISGYPTIKIFGRDKKAEPTNYSGEMKANAIAAAARKL